MVVRWWRRREPTWRRSLAINLLGATLSAAVLIVVALTKFEEGAWVVVVLIPLVVWTATRVHHHYRRAGEAIALAPLDPDAAHAVRPPRMFRVEETDGSVASEAAESPDEAEVVKLRFFAGLTLPEAARALGISLATAERHWAYARTWLYAELRDS